ncbi:MAG: hypothetical protein AAF403_00700 [Pseudomonadota bacterium]
MSNTRLEIANGALLKLGVKQLTSLDSLEPYASDVRQSLDRVGNLVLASHGWACASKRISIAPISARIGATTNINEAKRTKFRLPDDLVRIVKIEDKNSDSLYEWRKLIGEIEVYGEHANIKLTYVSTKALDDVIPSSLITAISYRLAYELCELITGSTSERASLLNEYERALSQAWLEDQQQNATDQAIASNWLA